MTTILKTSRWRDGAQADLAALRAWDLRRWAIAAAGAVGAAVISGVPTGIVATPVYARPIPVPGWAYPVWAISALIMGLLLAAMIGSRRAALSEAEAGNGPVVGGGVLSLIALGCPTCNAVAVAALGTGGALSVFAPMQPILGVAAIAILLAALHRRLQPPVCRVGGAA